MSNSILVSWPGPSPLGGVVCTSGIIALEESRFNKSSVAMEAQSSTPYLAYHGIPDPVEPFKLTNQTYDYYRDTLYANKTQNFHFEQDPHLIHTWDEKEFKYIKQWLKDKMQLKLKIE